MNRIQKRRILRNCKKIAVCGAALYLAVGVTKIGTEGSSSQTINAETAYAQQNQEKVVVRCTSTPLPRATEVPVITTAPTSTPVVSRWTEEERYLLARIAMAEAEGEDTEGKALVMLVVINRVEDCDFPSSIKDVIYQKNQFSSIFDGRWDKASEPSDDCWEALKLVENGWDGSKGALFFESTSSSTWHRDNLPYLFVHGNHYFYGK